MTAQMDAAPSLLPARLHVPRKLLMAGLAVVLAVFTVGWAVPNMAGPMFVHVAAIATPIASNGGPSIVVGGNPAVEASRVNVDVEVTNGYPLGVVVGTDPIAYVAAVYARDTHGQLQRVWRSDSGDPALEEGSDSPVGGGTAGGAIVVPPGSRKHQVAVGSAAFALTDSAGKPLAAGIYYLRVWAYGIGSPLVPMSIDGGTDPSGPPANLPTP